MKPAVSVITPTLNNEHEIVPFLNSIQNQKYPQEKIEILIIDGGSADATCKVALQNNCIVIPNPEVLAEPGVNIGMQKAKGQLMIVLATDNIFEDVHAFEKISKTFENPDVFAAFPKQDYKKSYNIFTKYHNTFTDPFNHFIHGYASNTRTFNRVYKTITSTPLYDIYDFHENPIIPMISLSQGFTIRSGYLREKSDQYDDNMPVIQLIRENKKLAYIHDLSVFHPTINNMYHFLRKQRWATRNALEKKNYGIAHRTSTLSRGQRIRMYLWPLYAFSLILPLLVGLYGLMRDKEPLWLFHPIDCWLSAYASLTELIAFQFQKTQQISRQ